MKDILTSTCEKEFILNINEKRIDGRLSSDGRTVTVLFGIDRGCCTVMLGNTRVLSQVSCEVIQPKPSRPSEGVLHVNLELSPMAAPNFETGRPTEVGIEYARLLERCIRDSHCIDLESLCIVAGEKVWSIRVDVHVLNHDGNILEGSSIAAIASLAHFRRPDVTVIGTEVTIHSVEEHEPIPLNLHHMPLCITFSVFHGKHLLVDPTEIEERVSDGKMVIGVNAHQEICTLHLSGSLQIFKEKILQCANMASARAQEITEIVKAALEKDNAKRASGDEVGFAALLHTDTILGMKYQPPSLTMDRALTEINVMEYSDDVIEISDSENKVNVLGPGTAFIGEEGASRWNVVVQADNEDTEDQLYDMKVPKWKDTSCAQDEQESEEEEVVTLQPEELGIKQEKGEQPKMKLMEESDESRQWWLPCKDESKVKNPCKDEFKVKTPHKDGSKAKKPHKDESKAKKPHKDESKTKKPHKDESKAKKPHRDESKAKKPHKDESKAKKPHIEEPSESEEDEPLNSEKTKVNKMKKEKTDEFSRGWYAKNAFL